MNRILCLVMALFIISCEKKELKASQIENYLDSIKSSNVNYRSNPLLKDELNSQLNSDLPEKINRGLFNDLEFYLNNIEKCDTTYFLVFEPRFITKNYKKPDVKIDLSVITKVPEKKAKSLSTREVYYIRGSYLPFTDNINDNFFCVYKLRSEFKGVGANGNDIDLGTITMKLDSIF